MLLLALPPMSAPPPTSIPIASPVRAFLVCPATLDGLPSHLHGFPKTHKKPENPEAPNARNLHPNTVSRKPRLGGAPFIPARKSLKARLSVHFTSGSGSALSPGGFESQEKQCFWAFGTPIKVAKICMGHGHDKTTVCTLKALVWGKPEPWKPSPTSPFPLVSSSTRAAGQPPEQKPLPSELWSPALPPRI